MYVENFRFVGSADGEGASEICATLDSDSTTGFERISR